MRAAVQIADVGFEYSGNSTPLYNHFNLEIEEGERFGLFGPNGAGKTTLMNLMTGLLSCTTGTIRLLGQEIKKNNKAVHKLFGLVPQDLSFYQELTPTENLEFFGACSGLRRHEVQPRIQDLLRTMDLNGVKDTPCEKLSGGMKRRVNLAIGVIHNPVLLFLDEPTVGVDVQTRLAIVDYLKMLNKNGTTLIYTSHQLSEAEALCTRIALIDGGKILAHDDLEKLLVKHDHNGLEDLFIDLTSRRREL